ncbi:MAG: tRNA dihydrouridine synthase DusB, partial [Helicobacter sp.]|nr:tRNA dihydrouridine synthase DusB [Helicobacter sp.]
IKDNLEETVALRERVTLEHFDKSIAFRGDYGAIMFRKNLHAYSKGLQGASEFRSKVNALTNPQEVRECILDFFQHTALIE